MYNIVSIHNQDTYIVEQRDFKVNILNGGNLENFDLSNFDLPFIISIDRILSNGYTDISFGFKDKINTPFTEALRYLLKRRFNLNILNNKFTIKAYVFVNKEQKAEFSTDDFGLSNFKRLNFIQLDTPFNKLNSIFIRFTFTSKVLGIEEELFKEYQVIFGNEIKNSQQISPQNLLFKIKVPYSYVFNFSENSTYWTKKYYHNIILELPKINNTNQFTNLLKITQFNDKKDNLMPGENNKNTDMQINVNEVHINNFLSKNEKINLHLEKENDDNVYHSGLIENNCYHKVARIDDYLTTNESDVTINKIPGLIPSKSLKIPYQYSGLLTFKFPISTPYFNFDFIKTFDIKPTQLYESNADKRLKITYFDDDNPKVTYRFVIDLKDSIKIIKEEFFNFNEFILDEQTKKRLNQKNQ